MKYCLCAYCLYNRSKIKVIHSLNHSPSMRQVRFVVYDCDTTVANVGGISMQTTQFRLSVLKRKRIRFSPRSTGTPFYFPLMERVHWIPWHLMDSCNGLKGQLKRCLETTEKHCICSRISQLEVLIRIQEY